MDIYKRILTITLIVFISMVMVACSSNIFEAKNFPVDEYGFPLKKFIINNKEYELKNIYSDNLQNLEIKLNISEKEDPYINVVLPRILPTHYWQIDEKLYPAIKKYAKEKTQINNKKQPEGPSNDLQIFTIDTTSIEGHSISFNWINSNEVEKPSKDRVISYTIKINYNKFY